MNRPRICVVIVDDDLKAVKEAEPLVDLFEVRLDLLGDGWPEVVKRLGKPWIACNRHVAEGGWWRGSEENRIEELLRAAGMGAEIVDVELRTENMEEVVKLVKNKAQCLISFHDLEGTPPLGELRAIVQRQLQAGADICKVITTGRKFEDNLTVLQLVAGSAGTRIVSFAMGEAGLLSRVLCPLAGGDFTYASVERGKESAPGQVTVKELRQLYQVMTE